MALDGLVLNGTNINDETNYGLEAIEIPPAPKREEWAESADADGADLIREPLYGNRVIPLTLRVGRQASMNVALEKISALVALFQEAEKNGSEGIPLEYAPATGSKTFTFYVLTGRVVAVPMVMETSDAGFYVFSPVLKCELTCKPFGYGPEEEVLAAKANETGLSVAIRALPEIKGDVPAEARLVVKDTAKVGRRFVEWGLENRHYQAATSLIEAAENLTPVGGTKSEAANTGAYKPGAGTKLTIATTLVGEPTVCCETAALKHIGTFRVKARVQAVLGSESVAENVRVRLSWQDGEGPFRANSWTVPVVGGKYVEVDLGPVTITEAQSGTQKWVGRIEAYSGNEAAKDVFHVNYLAIIPTERYGKAAGPTITSGGTVSAYDDFVGGSGSLNTRTPEIGAAWATSGAATDWGFTTYPLTGHSKGKAVERKTKSDAEPRYGVLGSSLTGSQATALFKNKEKPSGGTITQGLILRWTNSSNYAFGLMERSASSKPRFKIGTVVAGSTTVIAEAIKDLGAGENEFELTLSATADGTLSMTVAGQNVTVSGSATVLKTGETLASGKAGIYDKNTGTTEVVRTMAVISVLSLPSIPFVIQPERACEFRNDITLVQDSTGTYTGPPQIYRGSRFYLPQAGSAKRVSRLLVKADRNDLEEADQQTIADAFTIQVFATPRYVDLPH